MTTPLVLGATRSSWTVAPNHGSQQHGSTRLAALRPRILKRDDHTCQGCGWKSDQWQEIHHRDSDHRNCEERNLEVLCPLCHQVFHLPQAAATSGGSIIWLPEIDQATLNQMCIALFVVMRDPSNPLAGVAKSIHGTLEARRATMEAAFGRSDPGYLAQVLIKMSPDAYAARATAMAPLRLLANPSRFQYEIDYWRASRFQSILAERTKAAADLVPSKQE